MSDAQHSANRVALQIVEETQDARFTVIDLTRGSSNFDVTFGFFAADGQSGSPISLNLDPGAITAGPLIDNIWLLEGEGWGVEVHPEQIEWNPSTNILTLQWPPGYGSNSKLGIRIPQGLLSSTSELQNAANLTNFIN